MTEQGKTLPSQLGIISIADEVVSTITGLAAMDVEGVAAMSGGRGGGIVEALGRKSFARGVKVEVGAEDAVIDIYIIVLYGARIPDVAYEIQEKVRNAVENMTGLHAKKVNLHVQGVQFPQKEDITDIDLQEVGRTGSG